MADATPWFELTDQPPDTDTPEGKFLHGIRYHWDMLSDLSARLSRKQHRDDPVLWSALVESFLIHARVMVDAFYLTESEKPDDLTVATVGLERAAMPDVVREWRRAVHKRAAHLTDVEKVAWCWGPPVELLHGRMALLEAHLAKRAHETAEAGDGT